MRTAGGASPLGLDRMELLDDLQGKTHYVFIQHGCFIRECNGLNNAK